MILANPLLPFIFPIPCIAEESGPVSVTINSTKQYTQTKTTGGYTYSHWGDAPDIMEVSGSVVVAPGKEAEAFLSLIILKQLYRLDKNKIINMVAAASKILTSVQTIGTVGAELLDNYKNRGGVGADSQNFALTFGTLGATFSLIELYNRIQATEVSDLSWTYIYHDGFIYGGFFTNFTYKKDANRLNFVDYSFKFLVEWNTENLFADKILKAGGGSTVQGIQLSLGV